MKQYLDKELQPKTGKKKISQLSKETINKIVYMDSIGVKRGLIAKTYHLDYKELLTILPTSDRK